MSSSLMSSCLEIRWDFQGLSTNDFQITGSSDTITVSQADRKGLCMGKITDQIQTTRKMEILVVGRKTNFTDISTAVLSSEKGITSQAHQRVSNLNSLEPIF